MAQLMDRDGKPLMLRRSTSPERGHHAGITVRTSEDDAMARKAESTDVYTLNGARFRIRKGDPIPEGAELDSERSTGPAPENRKLDKAPENRSGKASKKDADS